MRRLFLSLQQHLSEVFSKYCTKKLGNPKHVLDYRGMWFCLCNHDWTNIFFCARSVIMYFGAYYLLLWQFVLQSLQHNDIIILVYIALLPPLKGWNNYSKIPTKSIIKNNKKTTTITSKTKRKRKAITSQFLCYCFFGFLAKQQLKCATFAQFATDIDFSFVCIDHKFDITQA